MGKDSLYEKCIKISNYFLESQIKLADSLTEEEQLKILSDINYYVNKFFELQKRIKKNTEQKERGISKMLTQDITKMPIITKELVDEDFIHELEKEFLLTLPDIDETDRSIETAINIFELEYNFYFEKYKLYEYLKDYKKTKYCLLMCDFLNESIETYYSNYPIRKI